jgi:hypothetical protein
VFLPSMNLRFEHALQHRLRFFHFRTACSPRQLIAACAKSPEMK